MRLWPSPTWHFFWNESFDKRSRKFLKKFWKFFDVFAEIRRKNLIFVIVRAPWHVREVESYAPSKSQSPTTLGDHQNVEKTIRKKSNFFGFRKSVFRLFSWILEGIDNLRRQNKFPREILFQIHLFWGPCDQKLRKNDLCCENLSSANPTRARPNLIISSRGCRPSPTNIKW